MVTLLPDNGERGVARGWDTRYDRLRDLPPTLLLEALHEVLSGWGKRAFDAPMNDLCIGNDGDPSETRHLQFASAWRD